MREQSLDLEVVVVVESNVEDDASRRRAIEVEPLRRIEVDKAAAEAIAVERRDLDVLRERRSRVAQHRETDRGRADVSGFRRSHSQRPVVLSSHRLVSENCPLATIVGTFNFEIGATRTDRWFA